MFAIHCVVNLAEEKQVMYIYCLYPTSFQKWFNLALVSVSWRSFFYVCVMIVLLPGDSGITRLIIGLLVWWTPALFSSSASQSRKMWISFFGRPDIAGLKGATSLLYGLFSPQNFSFESAVEKPSCMSAYVVNPHFSLLRMKLILWIYIVQVISFTFSLKCSVLKRSYDKHVVRMNCNSLHSAWGTPLCKSVTPRKIM